MFSISIPFPQRQQRKKKQGGGKTRAAAAPPPKPPPKPRPRLEWDSTTSDQSQYRLSEAEAEFRRSLRQSRHHLRSRCSSLAEGEAAAAATGGDGDGMLSAAAHDSLDAELQLELCGPVEQPAGGFAERSECGGGGESDGDDASSSLAGMRSFVNELRSKYGLADGAAPEAAPAPLQLPTPAGPRPLAALLQEQLLLQAAELAAGPSLWEQEAGEQQPAVGHSSLSSAASASCAAGHLDGSDSEGEGRLGPAALRREQRRAAAAAGGAVAGVQQQQQQQQQQQPHQQQAAAAKGELPGWAEMGGPLPAALLGRLAAAEARLERCEGLEGRLAAATAAVEALQEDNSQLRTELDECASHTSTLLTSLQAQLSRLLAGHGGGGDSSSHGAAGAERPPPAMRPRPPSPPAVTQARAVAEALCIAQQARALQRAISPVPAVAPAAAPALAQQGGGSSSERRAEDALAGLQLPAFRTFAELRGLAAAKPGSEGFLHAATQGGTAAAAAAAERENAPPHPRALPQSLQQQLGGGLAPSPVAGGGFQWRPASVAGSR